MESTLQSIKPFAEINGLVLKVLQDSLLSRSSKVGESLAQGHPESFMVDQEHSPRALYSTVNIAACPSVADKQ